jgi:hypothetical protein
MVASNFSDEFKTAMRERCLKWNRTIHTDPPLEKRIEKSKQRRKEKPTRGYTKFLGRHEHRVIMEKHLGRSLRSDEIVHHIDGDKTNNDISNLIIMSQSEHAKLHAFQNRGGDTP